MNIRNTYKYKTIIMKKKEEITKKNIELKLNENNYNIF